MKHHGKYRDRIKREPEEKAFADAWQRANDRGNLLGYLVGDDGRAAEPTPEQVETAATVIQWLGSHVGQCFLRDLGYEKVR